MMALNNGAPLNGMPQRDPFDGTPLSWSAHPSGIPIRSGDAPDLITKAQLSLAGSKPMGRSEILKIPEQLDRYNEIINWIAMLNAIGAATIRFEERIPDRANDGIWHVWISWVELRGFIPKDLSRLPPV